jgi:hypothetical protein
MRTLQTAIGMISLPSQEGKVRGNQAEVTFPALEGATSIDKLIAHKEAATEG